MKKITTLFTLALTIAPLALFSDDGIPVLDMRSPLETLINIRSAYIPHKYESKFSWLSIVLGAGGCLGEEMYRNHINKTIGTVEEKRVTQSDDVYHNYYTPKKGCGHHLCKGTNYNENCNYAKDWELKHPILVFDGLYTAAQDKTIYIPYPQYKDEPSTYGVGETGTDGVTLLSPKTIDGVKYTEGRFVPDWVNSGLSSNYYHKKIHNMDLTKSYICKRWAVCIATTAAQFALYASLIKGAHILYKKLRYPIKKDSDNPQDIDTPQTENAESSETTKESQELIAIKEMPAKDYE